MNKEEFIQIINSNKHLENIVTNDITMDVINKILNECDSDQLIECSQDYENEKISILGAILIYMINNQDQKLLSQELINLFTNIKSLNSTAKTLDDGRTVTLLGLAIANDRTDIVEMMLENYNDPDSLNNAVETPTDESMTPFGLAISFNNTKIVEMMLKKYQSQDLLNKKAKIFSNGGSVTPLGLAIANDRTDIVEMILKSNTDPDLLIKTNETLTDLISVTPLGLAIANDRTDIVEMILKDYPEQDLLNKIAEILYDDDNKISSTPFGLALTYGRADIVNMLLKDYPEQDLPNKVAHTSDERESITPLDYLLLNVPDAKFNHEILDLVVKFTAHQKELDDPHSRLKQEHKNNIKINNHTLNFLYNTNDSRDLDINDLNKKYLKILFEKHGVPPHFPRVNQEDKDFYQSIITDPNNELFNNIAVHIGAILEQLNIAASPAPYHLLLKSTTDIDIRDTDTPNALKFYQENPQYIPENLFNPDEKSEAVRKHYLDIIKYKENLIKSDEISEEDRKHYLDIISSIREEIAQIIELSQNLILPEHKHKIRNKMIGEYREIMSQDHKLCAIDTDLPGNDPSGTSSRKGLVAEGDSLSSADRSHNTEDEGREVTELQVTSGDVRIWVMAQDTSITVTTNPLQLQPGTTFSRRVGWSREQGEGDCGLLDTLIRYLGGPLLTTLSRYIYLYITIQSLETIEKYCSLLSNHEKLLELDFAADCPYNDCDNNYGTICDRDIDSIFPLIDTNLGDGATEFCDLKKVEELGNYLTPTYYYIGLAALADVISQCFINMYKHTIGENVPRSRARSCEDLLVIPIINILITFALTFHKVNNIHIDYLNEQRDNEDDNNISKEIICKIASITKDNKNALELLNKSFSASGIAFSAIAFLTPFIMLMQLCLNNTENQDGIELSNANSIGNTRPEPEGVEENQFSPGTAVTAGSTSTLVEVEGELSQSV